MALGNRQYMLKAKLVTLRSSGTGCLPFPF